METGPAAPFCPSAPDRPRAATGSPPSPDGAPTGGITRRRALELLGLAGLAVPVGGSILAQERPLITAEALAEADVVLGEEISAERLEVIAPALQANMDQFRLVRELEIDDLVEPPTLFVAGWG